MATRSAMAQKFLFEDSFDGESEQPDPAVKKPPPPSFTEADLAESERKGFAAGHGAGLEEARQDAECRAANALETLAGELEVLGRQAACAAERRERETLELARRALAKLFPALARRGALEESEKLVEDCLERLRDEPRVVLRTADGLHDALRDRVDALAARSGFEGRVVLLTEAGLGASDVRVEWADGGAERDVGRLWSEIEQVLDLALDDTGDGDDADRAPPPDAIEAPEATSDAIEELAAATGAIEEPEAAPDKPGPANADTEPAAGMPTA